MKNSSKNLSTTKSNHSWAWLVIITVFCFYMHSILQFSISYLEVLDLKDTVRPLLDIFYTKDHHIAISPDRGPLFTLFARMIISFGSDNIYFLRFVNLLFFIGCLIAILQIRTLDSLQKLATVILLSFNFKSLILFTRFNHYAMGMFFCSLVLKIHLDFDSSQKNIKKHALYSTLSILAIYTSILPCFISFLVLFHKKRNLIKPSIKYYSPIIIYSVYKFFMVIEYRFVDLISHNGSNSTYLIDNSFSLFNFTYLNALSAPLSLNHLLLIILFATLLAPFLLSITYFCSQHRDRLLTFNTIYAFIFLVTFISFNMYGAEEIDSRYYLPYLIIFYLSIIQAYKLFLKKKIYLFMTLLLVLTNTIVGINSAKAYLFYPIQEIYSELEKKDSLTCLNLIDEQILNFLGYYHSKGKVKNYATTRNRHCIDGKEFTNYKSIRIISREKFPDNLSDCENSEFVYCKNKYLQKELLKRTLISLREIKKKKRDHTGFLYTYQ